MTEQNNASAQVEEIIPAVDTTPSPKPSRTKNNRSGAIGIALGTLAIAIALAVGAGLYSYGKNQISAQSIASDTLSARLNTLQQQQEQQKAAFDSTLKQQADALTLAHNQQAALTQQLQEMQHKIASIAGNDAKNWLLAQADFLVKLAGRKLWSDQDTTTALALLKSADTSLAQMNDPSLLNVRRAITDDIGTISGISQIDYDGIILKLNQLSNQIDNLRLADNDSDGAPMDADNKELSGTLKEWRQNLLKSWRNFMDNFITIRRRDDTALPLLAPNQDIYLRENIRSQLLIAAQAVPRHQDETYKQSLENASTWIRAYYNTSDAATKAFLTEMDTLGQQSINMDIPETLQSQPQIEKLMRTRIRNFLTQSTNPGNTATDAAPVTTSGQGE